MTRILLRYLQQRAQNSVKLLSDQVDQLWQQLQDSLTQNKEIA